VSFLTSGFVLIFLERDLTLVTLVQMVDNFPYHRTNHRNGNFQYSFVNSQRRRKFGRCDDALAYRKLISPPFECVRCIDRSVADSIPFENRVPFSLFAVSTFISNSLECFLAVEVRKFISKRYTSARNYSLRLSSGSTLSFLASPQAVSYSLSNFAVDFSTEG
jgi:hypothetical protein